MNKLPASITFEEYLHHPEKWPRHKIPDGVKIKIVDVDINGKEIPGKKPIYLLQNK